MELQLISLVSMSTVSTWQLSQLYSTPPTYQPHWTSLLSVLVCRYRCLCVYVCSYCFLSAAPSGAPRNVSTLLVSSRSITVVWDPIACTERNREITGYTVQFYQPGGGVVPEITTNRNFTATGLQPFTSYTFQVAGFNINGTGPFAETTHFATREAGIYHVIE